MNTAALRSVLLSDRCQRMPAQAQLLLVRLLIIADGVPPRLPALSPADIRPMLFASPSAIRVADYARLFSVLENAGYIRRRDRQDQPPEFSDYLDQIIAFSSANSDSDFAVSAALAYGCARTFKENNTIRERESNNAREKYPSTVEEVVAMGADPRVGIDVTAEEADAYLTARLAADWVDAMRRQIQPHGVPYDFKRFVLLVRSGRRQPVRRQSRNVLDNLPDYEKEGLNNAKY